MTNTDPIPADVARRIWDILAEECGASTHPDVAGDFLWSQERGDCREYRFCGSLGFGGKFRNDHGNWRVTCYSEDETPKRKSAITRANARLAGLRAGAAAGAERAPQQKETTP